MKNRPSKEKLRKLYIDEHKSTVEIGKIYGVSKVTAGKWLNAVNISRRSASESQLPVGFVKPSKEELKRLYINEHKTPKQIGEIYEICTEAIRIRLKDAKIKLRNLSEAKLPVGFVKPSKEELKRLYIDEHKNGKQIGKIYGVSNSAVYNWLRDADISVRSISEVQLPVGFVKPSKEELKRLYIDEHKSSIQIGKIYRVSNCVVSKWLKSANINLRDISEAQLSVGVVKPSKEELKRLYIDEHKNGKQIGKIYNVSFSTVYNWLRDADISVRSLSEAKLPTGIVKPSKEELKRLYIDEHKSSIQIGKIYGVSRGIVGGWLKTADIPIRSNRSLTPAKFASSMKKDDKLLALAYAATNSNGLGYDFEKIIMETYDGNFKDQKQLHELLEQNAARIKKLVESGVTNLGAYIGQFSLGDRRIFPLIVEGAVDAIPDSKITSSLEERIARMLRMSYSPRFNDEPEKTLNELEAKVQACDGKKKQVYENLLQHYRDVQEIGEELR